MTTKKKKFSGADGRRRKEANNGTFASHDADKKHQVLHCKTTAVK